MTYNPPTKNSSRQMPYRALVAQIDPDFERLKHRELEYAFTGHPFFADPDKRGAFNRLGNSYPVGAAQGSVDPAVEAALAPTTGNPTPGLYKSVDTPGWDS